MTLSPDRERVRQVLADTVGLLCKNGLSFDAELSVDALIGITIDRQEVFLVSIKETYISEKKLPKSSIGTHPDDIQMVQRLCKDVIEEKEAPDSASRCCSSSVNSGKKRPMKSALTSDMQTKSTSLDLVKRFHHKRTVQKYQFLDSRSKKARMSEVEARKPDGEANVQVPTIIKTEPSETFVSCETLDTASIALTFPSDYDNLSHGISKPGFERNCCSRSSVEFPEPGKLLFCSEDCTYEKNGAHSSSKETSDISLATSECHTVVSNLTNISFDGDAVDMHCRTHSASKMPSDDRFRKSSPVEQMSFQASSSDSRLVDDTFNTTKQVADGCGLNNSSQSELPDDCPSSDSDVICLKEEISLEPSPYHTPGHSIIVSPFRGSLVSLPADNQSLDCFGSKGWNDSYHVQKQRKDWEYAWSNEGLVPSTFEMEARSLGKQTVLAIQAILLYDGQYVPLRDIQRLRLCGMAAGQIKMAMVKLSSYEGKLGCFQMLHGGVNMFYKCPPDLVDREMLESYAIPWETYKFHYDVLPASNITTKHSEQYWLKVASSSPYHSANLS